MMADGGWGYRRTRWLVIKHGSGRVRPRAGWAWDGAARRKALQRANVDIARDAVSWLGLQNCLRAARCSRRQGRLPALKLELVGVTPVYAGVCGRRAGAAGLRALGWTGLGHGSSEDTTATVTAAAAAGSGGGRRLGCVGVQRGAGQRAKR